MESLQRTAGGQQVLAGGGEPAVAAPQPQGAPVRQLSGQLPSWQRDVALYVDSNGGGTPADVRSRRAALHTSLREKPESADRWLAFLQYEERLLSGCTNPLDAATSGGRHGVTLLHLYDWATKLVPKRANQHNDAYLQIWLGYARNLGHSNEDDARDTFKMLKNQTFGEKSAALYKEWAAFEVSKGNRREAVARVKKGQKMGAEPASLLQDCLQELQGVNDFQSDGRVARTPGASTGSLTLSSNDASTSDILEASTGTITVTAGLRMEARVHGTPTIQHSHVTVAEVTGSTAPPPRPPAKAPPLEASKPTEGEHTASTTGGLPPAPTTGTLTRGLPSAATPGAPPPGSNSVSRPSSNTKPLRRLHGLRGLGGPARRVVAGGVPAVASASASVEIVEGTTSTPPESTQDSAQDGAETDGGSGRKRKAESPEVRPTAEEEVSTAPDSAPVQPPGRLSGVDPPGSRAGESAAVDENDEKEDTIPIGGSVLAQRVLKGRPSLAPSTMTSASAVGVPSAPQSSKPEPRPILIERQAPAPAHAPPPASVASPVEEVASNASAANHALRASVEPHQPQRQAVPAPPTPKAPPTFAESGAPHAPAQPPRERAAATKAAAESAAAKAPAPVSRPREDEKSVVVKGVRYTKLEVVGRGGSSKVFKVIAPNHQIYALKRIRLHGRDSESASGFVDEIRMLHKLRKKDNIIQLIDAEVVERDKTIYLVLEYGEIDLATMLSRKQKLRASGEEELDENFVRLYWQQMLQAVATIHNERIVHSDLKPANFIFVKGQLKLLDFGIAKSMQADTTSIVRENQVGTLNYMSPEAILGGNNNIRGAPPMRVGRASDLWALGCILYQMVHGATPFAPLPFIQKMHAITDSSRPINFPTVENAALQDVLQRCLDRNPATRITMEELLAHPFLHPSKASPPPEPASQPVAGFTKDHLKMMLSAMVAASGGGGSVDVDHLAEAVFQKLSLGEQPDFQGVVSSAIRAAATDARPPLSSSTAINTQPSRSGQDMIKGGVQGWPPSAQQNMKENAVLRR